ncbi:hypothetical protein ACIPC1_35690 [Streptomyces sp. NPDC087263]|uniref:hypothetical protein n=1 Tax=Streptomyces sp. NPDC087263 TaxID=3365773 RepID=UPI00381069C2
MPWEGLVMERAVEVTEGPVKQAALRALVGLRGLPLPTSVDGREPIALAPG